MSKLSLKDRINLVLSQRAEMVVSRVEAQNHPGFTTEEYAELGLDKAQLKKLERLGFALRGYTTNFRLPDPEKEPDAYVPVKITKKEAYTNERGYERTRKTQVEELRPIHVYRGKGHQTRYILVVAE